MDRPGVVVDVEAVAQMIELGAEVMSRYLVDRDQFSASAVSVLDLLSRRGPVRLTVLAKAEDASQSAMTQLVQRMERQGLLERHRDPQDGRASLVTLSESGRRRWDARADLRRRRLADILVALSEDDQVALMLAAHVVTRALSPIRSASDGGL